jgi:fumarylpyruvate hydrolase
MPEERNVPDFAFAPPGISSVAIAGESERFPVRRIFCVGRNYAAHAREMGRDPDREPPFFFTKPADTVVDSGAVIPYPPQTNNFHYEIELVVGIGKGGADIPAGKALDHVWGYAVGIDLTRRDLQLDARDKGRPWDWGKAFDLSAPCAPLHRAKNIGHPSSGRIWLAVNGVVKQNADLGELIWSVPDIVAILSQSMTLQPGDLIMTGTPAGVGAIVPGDIVTGGIEGLGDIDITISEPAGKVA